MFWRTDSERTDPRSPVQPDKGTAGLLLLAGVVAVAIWTLLQTGLVDTPSWPTRQQSQNPPPRSEPAQQSSEEVATGPASARGSLTGLFRSEDYPAAALDANEQGAVRVRLEIDRQGRVSSCEVIESSGHSSLDVATCRIVQRRAHFLPARDANGNPITSSYAQTIKWQIAE